MQSAAVIRCHRQHLEQRCAERGHTLDEVMPCVVAQDGDEWTIDTAHSAYPRHPKPGHGQSPASPSSGPGTELANILHRLHIAPAPTCQCREMAAQMDAWGVEECSRPERIEEVVAVMRDEANRRGLPFLDAAGRALVRIAIRNARRAAAN